MIYQTAFGLPFNNSCRKTPGLMNTDFSGSLSPLEAISSSNWIQSICIEHKRIRYEFRVLSSPFHSGTFRKESKALVLNPIKSIVFNSNSRLYTRTASTVRKAGAAGSRASAVNTGLKRPAAFNQFIWGCVITTRPHFLLFLRPVFYYHFVGWGVLRPSILLSLVLRLFSLFNDRNLQRPAGLGLQACSPFIVFYTKVYHSAMQLREQGLPVLFFWSADERKTITFSVEKTLERWIFRWYALVGWREERDAPALRSGSTNGLLATSSLFNWIKLWLRSRRHAPMSRAAH